MGTCVACCSAMPSMRTRQHHSAQVLAPALADVGSWLMVLDLVCPLAKLSTSSIGIAIEDRDCDGWICTTCTVVLWIAYWSFDQDSAIIFNRHRAACAVRSNSGSPADPCGSAAACALRSAQPQAKTKCICMHGSRHQPPSMLRCGRVCGPACGGHTTRHAIDESRDTLSLSCVDCRETLTKT